MQNKTVSLYVLRNNLNRFISGLITIKRIDRMREIRLQCPKIKKTYDVKDERGRFGMSLKSISLLLYVHTIEIKWGKFKIKS